MPDVSLALLLHSGLDGKAVGGSNTLSRVRNRAASSLACILALSLSANLSSFEFDSSSPMPRSDSLIESLSSGCELP